MIYLKCRLLLLSIIYTYLKPKWLGGFEIIILLSAILDESHSLIMFKSELKLHEIKWQRPRLIEFEMELCKHYIRPMSC